MKRSRSDLFVLGLGAALLVQSGLFLYRQAAPGITPDDRPVVGDRIEALALTDGFGEPVRTASDADAQPLLLMAFHSECQWCRQVAPAWAEWLKTPPAGVTILAVSGEPIEDARAYAAEMGWDVEVGHIEVPENGSLEHALVSRTPWLFLLDGDGTLRYEGQGATLAALEVQLGLRAPTYSADEQQ